MSIFYVFLQNDQELEMSSVFINDNFDAITDVGYEEAEPGKTPEVKSTYKLLNHMDDVNIRLFLGCRDR